MPGLIPAASEVVEKHSRSRPRNAGAFILDTVLTFRMPLRNSKCRGEVICGVCVHVNEISDDAVPQCFQLHDLMSVCAHGGEKWGDTEL